MFDLVISEAGTLHYQKEACELGPLVLRSCELLAPEFEELEIKMEIDTTAISGYRIMADPKRIRQVIDNVLQNSVKYTDPQGRLQITCESEQGWLWVHFQDSKPGVGDLDLERLFDRLYRVEKSRNRATGGAGLGLAICKTIIEGHEGQLLARHSPLGGLWISLGLPKFNKQAFGE